MLIVTDFKEQAPFSFRHERYKAKTREETLVVGDYSLAGLEDKVAVEKKSLPDLVTYLARVVSLWNDSRRIQVCRATKWLGFLQKRPFWRNANVDFYRKSTFICFKVIYKILNPGKKS